MKTIHSQQCNMQNFILTNNGMRVHHLFLRPSQLQLKLLQTHKLAWPGPQNLRSRRKAVNSNNPEMRSISNVTFRIERFYPTDPHSPQPAHRVLIYFVNP